jgi:hypothetical protein
MRIAATWPDAARVFTRFVRHRRVVMLDLFIACSARAQSENEVRGLVEDLVALGDAVGTSPEPHGGTGWWDQTLARIRACDALLFVLAPRTLESEACLRQIRYAQALDKPLVAVELSERADLVSLPVLLSGARFVNYRRRDREGALRLCRVLRSLSKAPPLAALLPAPPELPPADLVSLRERVASPGKLDVQQQMALIAELSRDSRAAQVGPECRELLLALRRRRDVAPSAIVGIDALLRKTAETRINMRRADLLEPPRSRASRALADAPSRGPSMLLVPSAHGVRHASRLPVARHEPTLLAKLGRVLAALVLLLVLPAMAWLVAARLHHGALADWELGDIALTSGQLGVLCGVGASVFAVLSLVMLRRAPATRTSSATR